MKKTRQRSSNPRTVNENSQLRRENSRLRKQVQRLNGAINSMTWKGFLEDEKDDYPPPDLPTKESQQAGPPGKTCPKCGKETGEVMFGKYAYIFCGHCSYRERKPGSH